MTQHDNTNRGAIWKNERKEQETHPDFTGSLNVEGIDYFFDAWKRKPDASEKAPALSFRVKRKDKQNASPQAAQRTAQDASGGADFDDEIPF